MERIGSKGKKHGPSREPRNVRFHVSAPNFVGFEASIKCDLFLAYLLKGALDKISRLNLQGGRAMGGVLCEEVVFQDLDQQRRLERERKAGAGRLAETKKGAEQAEVAIQEAICCSQNSASDGNGLIDGFGGWAGLVYRSFWLRGGRWWHA